MANPYITTPTFGAPRQSRRAENGGPGQAFLRLRKLVESFARYQRDNDEPSGGAFASLKEVMKSLASFGTPNEAKHLSGQVRLYASLCSVLHRKVLDGEREVVYRSARQRLALLLREGFAVKKVNGAPNDPVAVGKALKDQDEQSWWKLVNSFRSAAVRGEVHPWGVLNLGGWPTLAREAELLTWARGIIVDLSGKKLSDEIERGYTGPKGVAAFITELTRLGERDFDAFARVDQPLQALRAFAAERRWKLEIPTDDTAEEETTAEKVAQALGDVVTQALNACEIDGDEATAIRKDVTGAFRNTNDLLNHRDSAVGYYTEEVSETFATALLKAAETKVEKRTKKSASKAKANSESPKQVASERTGTVAASGGNAAELAKALGQANGLAGTVREALAGAPSESVEAAVKFITATYQTPAGVAALRPKVLVEDLKGAGISGIADGRAKSVIAAAEALADGPTV